MTAPILPSCPGKGEKALRRKLPTTGVNAEASRGREAACAARRRTGESVAMAGKGEKVLDTAEGERLICTVWYRKFILNGLCDTVA